MNWNPFTVTPVTPEKAIIVIDGETGLFPLPELYAWDVDEGYWVSASSKLRLKHREFLWMPIRPLMGMAS